MKTIITAAALIASSFTPVAFPTFVSTAAAETVAGSYCALSTRQEAKGWTCNFDAQITYYSQIVYVEECGEFTCVGGDGCADFQSTDGTYVRINPHGRESRRFAATPDAEQIGQPYATRNLSVLYTTPPTCHYPLG